MTRAVVEASALVVTFMDNCAPGILMPAPPTFLNVNTNLDLVHWGIVFRTNFNQNQILNFMTLILKVLDINKLQ